MYLNNSRDTVNSDCASEEEDEYEVFKVNSVSFIETIFKRFSSRSTVRLKI